MPFKYKTVEELTVEEFEKQKLRKIMEIVNGRQTEERMGGFYRRDDLLNRKTNPNGGEGSNIDVEIFEHSQQNKQIRRVGEDQDSKRQDSINTNESLIGGNENRQRDGAAGLTDDPNGRYSKNDTIFDLSRFVLYYNQNI